MRQILAYILIAGAVFAPIATIQAEDEPSSLAAALTKAGAALEDGLYAFAEQQLAVFIASNPPEEQREKAVLLMAHALWGQKRHADTLDLLEPYGKNPAFIYWRARSLYELKLFIPALTLLDENSAVLAASEYAAVTLRLKGHIQLGSGQLDAAEKSFREYAQKYPESSEAVANAIDLADVCRRQGRIDDALAVLKGVAEGPESEAAQKAQWQLGHLLYEQGTQEGYNAARNVLGGLASNRFARLSYRIDAWVDIAAVEEKSGRIPEAIEALETAVLLVPDAAQRILLRISQAKLLMRQDKYESALRLLEECRSEAPSEAVAAEVQLEKAELLLKQGNVEQADEAYQVYLDVSDDEAGKARAHFGKGESLWVLERYAEAAAAFDKASRGVAGSDVRADAFFRAGDAYFAAGQFEEALKRYRLVSAEFPESTRIPNARYQEGITLLKLERREEALTTFELLEARFPTDLFAEKAALRIADVLLDGRSWRAALNKYTHIGNTYTNSPVVALTLHQSGVLLYRLGVYDEAQLAFESVIERFPDSEYVPQASYMRGFCLYLQGQVEEAVTACEAFISTYPDSEWTVEVLFWLAEQYFNGGVYDKAETFFLRIVRDYKDDPLAPESLYWAGRAAAVQGNFVKAIEYYSRVAKEYSASPVLARTRFSQGDALSELGEFSRAILAFEEIIKNYPNSYLVNAAWGRKGDCQFALASEASPERYTEAAHSYQAVLDRPSASDALKLQAEYKIGKCMERTGAVEKAFAHYMNVVYTFLNQKIERSPDSMLYFTRAAFGAAAIKERGKAWTEAVQVYERVVEAPVSATTKEEASRRIENIRKENWMLFEKSEEIKNAGTDG